MGSSGKVAEGAQPSVPAAPPSEAPRGYNKKVPLLIPWISSTRPKSCSWLFLTIVQMMHLAHEDLPERMWAPSSSPAGSLAFQKLQGLLPSTHHLQASRSLHIHPSPVPAVLRAPQAPGISRGSTFKGGERHNCPVAAKFKCKRNQPSSGDKALAVSTEDFRYQQPVATGSSPPSYPPEPLLLSRLHSNQKQCQG